MKILLRKIISGYIVPYFLWFQLVRKQKGLEVGFFQKDTNAYIDGYARSGNTFIIHLVRHLLPDLKVVHHLHAVAPIKMALLLNIPTFVLIREPMECISSKYLKHFSMRGEDIDKTIDEKLLASFIADYVYYYNFVAKNKNELEVIAFEKLIEEPQKVLLKLIEQLKIDNKISDEQFLETKNSYQGATKTFGSSLPNSQKEKYKSIIKEHIFKQDGYEAALHLHQTILNRLKL